MKRFKSIEIYKYSEVLHIITWQSYLHYQLVTNSQLPIRQASSTPSRISDI
jgi:hypothetical protein